MRTEFIRFVIVGILGFFVDGGGTWLLVHAGLPPLIARVPALLAAVVVTWLLNRTLTFRVEATINANELMRYAVIALSNALVNYLLYGLLLAAGLAPLPAVVVSTVLLMGCSFFFYRRIAFR